MTVAFQFQSASGRELRMSLAFGVACGQGNVQPSGVPAYLKVWLPQKLGEYSAEAGATSGLYTRDWVSKMVP